MKQTIVKPRLVLVEGKDDDLFLRALMEHHEIDDVDVWCMDGKDNLSAELEAVRLTPGFESLQTVAVIRDADATPSNARASVCAAIERWHARGDAPTCSLFLLPDNEQPGVLEDLCLASIGKHPIVACVDQFVDCVQNQGCDLPRLSKTKVCAYLACQPHPEPRIGIAAQRGAWNFKAAAVRPLVDFLYNF